jgi:hypothetical protein
MYGSNCKIADNNGAHVLHGCRRVFHNDKEPAFRAIYMSFQSVSNKKKKLMQPMIAFDDGHFYFFFKLVYFLPLNIHTQVEHKGDRLRLKRSPSSSNRIDIMIISYLHFNQQN